MKPDLAETRTASLLLWAPGLVALLMWSGPALLLPEDREEGLHHYAASRAAAGDLLYRDLSYPRPPVLPYAYAVGGRSLGAGRLISILLGAVAVGLFAIILRRENAAGLLALLLLATQGHLAAALPLLKPTALTLVATLLAFLLAQEDTPRRRFLAGLCLGVGVATDLLHAVTAALFSAGLALQAGDRPRRLLTLAGGIVAGLLPCAIPLALDPRGFLAGEPTGGLLVGFSADPREPLGRWENFVSFLDRPQWLILLGLAAIGVALQRGGLASLCAAGALLSAWLPVPRNDGVLVTALPFLILAALPVLRILATPKFMPAALLLLALYAVNAAAELERSTGGDPYYVNPANHPEEIRSVADAISRFSRKDEVVLAHWAAYAAAAGVRVPRGLEIDLAGRPADRATFEAWIKERRFGVVQIGGPELPDAMTARLVRAADASGYRLVFSRFGRSVHLRE